MRLFYLAYPEQLISETLSRKLAGQEKSETTTRIFNLEDLMTIFPFSWSHYAVLQEL